MSLLFKIIVQDQPTHLLSATTADLAADLLLVMVPAYLLSDVKLPRKQKLLIILLGSGSFLTLLSVIVVTVVLYGPFIHNDGWNLVVEALSHMVVRYAPFSDLH